MSLAANNDNKSVKIDFDQLTLTDDLEILKLFKDHSTSLRFPEKLMMLMTYIDLVCIKRGDEPEHACMSWSRDGGALIIRDHDDLVNRLLPEVFRTKGSFASFTRKLYRWGFRQKVTKPQKRVTQLIAASAKVFFHKRFQRDNKQLLAGMKSISADRTSQARLTSTRANQHRETQCASVPTFSTPQEQNALIGLLTESYVQPLGHAALIAAASSTDFAASPSLLGNVLAGPTTLGISSPMLSVLARQHFMMRATAAPSPFFPTTAESDLLQRELALHALRRSRVQDCLFSTWQNLPSFVEQAFPPTTSRIWNALP